VNPVLATEAVSFGAAAERAFADLGGVDAARNGARAAAADALKSLGIQDLDPRVDIDTASAAGELCRQAGRVVLPYPVVGALLSVGGRPLALGPAPVDHGDLFAEWIVRSLDGSGHVASPHGGSLGSRLGPFVTPVTLGSPVTESAVDALLHLALTGWWILGVVERAVELAVEHVTGRIQFGQPLSAFQAVQFQLADAAVAVDGLREMTRYTTWRVLDHPASALPDALALRLYALDSARAVLRTCQQLHGAAGVCDEYDISVMCRHIQPALRLPFGAERTATEMAIEVSRSGFESLFPHRV
jgi:acyl-CoA dehydrogenase